MKVSLREEPAWKRVLDIEIDAEKVGAAMDAVVREYQRSVSMPGFRKGKVPSEVVRKRYGQDLEGEVLRRVLPEAVHHAIEENKLHTIGDPSISNLKFEPGQPLTFTATLEVMPKVEITGYDGLTLTRQQPKVGDEEISKVLDKLRDDRSDLEPTDRPSQHGDVITITYVELEASGEAKAGEEPTEMVLELGSTRTPQSFNEGLLGVVAGEAKLIPLPYPADYPEADLAGTTRQFQVTVVKIEEKIWPPVDDAFAKKVLGTEDVTADDLKSRVRLNLEMEAKLQSMRALENNLIGRLLELNPFDLPAAAVESSLERVMEKVKKDHPQMPPDEEAKVREHYKARVESNYRVDILLDAVGEQEQITVSDEDLDKEIALHAENEGEDPAKLRARLKKEGGVERLRDDMFRRQVVERLIDKADITVVDVAQETEETA